MFHQPALVSHGHCSLCLCRSEKKNEKKKKKQRENGLGCKTENKMKK
jgi:hypothetical protein